MSYDLIIRSYTSWHSLIGCGTKHSTRSHPDKSKTNSVFPHLEKLQNLTADHEFHQQCNSRIARQVSRRTIYMPPPIEILVVVRYHVTLRGSLAYPINLNRFYIYFNKPLRASLTPILFSFHFSPTLRLLLLFIRIILRNLFCFYFISTLSLSLSL